MNKGPRDLRNPHLIITIFFDKINKNNFIFNNITLKYNFDVCFLMQ